MPKLKQYFPDPLAPTVNIKFFPFGEYYTKYGDDAEWISHFSANTLDIDYLYARSGEKWASPLLERLGGLEVEYDEPSAWLAERVADLMHNRYTEQWNRLYEALFSDYDPIENYSMTETTTHGHKVTDGGTDAVTYGRKDTNSGTDQLTHGHTITAGGEDEITYGKTSTDSGSDDVSHGHKVTDGGTESIGYGKTSTDSGSDGVAHGHTINTDTRSDAVQQDSVYGFNTTESATPTASVGVSTSGGTDTFTTTDNRGVPSSASLGGTKGAGTETHSGTDTTTYGKVNTEGGTDTTTFGKTETHSGTDTTTYGKVNTEGGSDTTEYGKTESHTGTDTTTYGKVNTQSGTDSTQYGKTETHSGQDTLTRSGNIGVTTSQQMIEQEELLRSRNRFLEVVFNNVDELLALSIY